VAAGYVRLDWQDAPATPAQVRAVYEHALQLMQQHNTARLLSVHNQRPPIPPALTSWLGENWVPRAMRSVGHGRCAVVETSPTQSQAIVHTVGAALEEPLEYQFFTTTEAADTWLREGLGKKG